MKNQVSLLLIIVVLVLGLAGCEESDISKWNRLNEEFGQLQADYNALKPVTDSITSTDDLTALEADLAEFDGTSQEIIARAEELEKEFTQYIDVIEPDIYTENLEAASDVLAQMKLIRLSTVFVGEHRIWEKKNRSANVAWEKLDLAGNFLTVLSELEDGLEALGFSPEYEHYQNLKGSIEVARDQVMRTVAALSE